MLKDILTKVIGIQQARSAESQPVKLHGIGECVKILTFRYHNHLVLTAGLTKFTDAVRSSSPGFV